MLTLTQRAHATGPLLGSFDASDLHFHQGGLGVLSRSLPSFTDRPEQRLAELIVATTPQLLRNLA